MNLNDFHNRDEESSEGTPQPTIVRSLDSLVASELRFSTVYADPPWRYSNAACRGVSNRHHRTMTVQEICSEPVESLTTETAHLHLWTTNTFLREAFEVIEALGFTFKSCLVWIKPHPGMGNDCHASHDFLLLGIRRSLPFHHRPRRGWILKRRTAHSHKPHVIRKLIEQVNPGPYLELYGREETPQSQWTVYVR